MTEQQTERLISAIEEISSALAIANNNLCELTVNSDWILKELGNIDRTLNEANDKN